jgi:hypothetical protein
LLREIYNELPFRTAKKILEQYFLKF